MKRKVSPETSRPPQTASEASGRVFVAGVVVRVRPDGSVILRLGNRQEVPCRRANTVDKDWLRALVAVGPVEAEGTFDPDEGTGSIWCVFPGPEHADVAVPVLSLRATERVSIQCGKASLALEKDGSLAVRGRDILTRGSRSARISGGIVRIN